MFTWKSKSYPLENHQKFGDSEHDNVLGKAEELILLKRK